MVLGASNTRGRQAAGFEHIDQARRDMSVTRRQVGMWVGMSAAVALTAGAMITSAAANTEAAAIVGAPAPQFSAMNSAGETISLSDFAGKRVVLEWTNDGCPFVQKHYDPSHNNMQTMQSELTAGDDGVIWLSVISSAPGKQGYADGARADRLTEERGAAPSHVLLDPQGDLGRLYGAQTTPHMYVIDQDGPATLVYAGAIDSNSSANPDDIPDATNYVTAALSNLEAGEPVEIAQTKAYGCSVKY